MAKLTKGKEFPVIKFCWADIDQEEYYVSGVTDSVLQDIASRIGSLMMEGASWSEALESACDSFLRKI